MDNLYSTPAFSFGTKAETLQNLKPLITQAQIADLHFFTLMQWSVTPDSILDIIQDTFKGHQLAIRSSALAEDGAEHSMAGAFLSKLDVDSKNRSHLKDAINEVAASMTDHPYDQILIQPMVTDIVVSGVIMTFDMVNGAPYFCIDYDDETGRTDAVTSGNGIHKSLYVHRDTSNELIRSTRIAAFLRLARELESICRSAALDIEFGLNKSGELFLFQARRIALARHWHPVTERRVKRQLVHVRDFISNCSKPRDGIVGDRTILAIMPDWNPAEIIGTTPRPLAASLYRELITKTTWCSARATMGYRFLGESDLMVMINNHPYIDVRNSFNSFLPATLPDTLGRKLVNAWLDRLEAYPEAHDKIEFDVVPTCLDFCFTEDFKTRYPNLLEDQEFDSLKQALTELTRECLKPGAENTLDRALAAASHLEALVLPAIFDTPGHEHLARAGYLLTQCRELGTYPFSIVARHAFIAEALLRSAVKRGALTSARLTEFKRSIRTITGDMLEEYGQVCDGQLARSDFFSKYGHLRPGTYEITSLRYDERDDLFLESMPQSHAPNSWLFTPTEAERQTLDKLLRESGLDVLDTDGLLAYAQKAIAAREHVKFIFTHTLSDALSGILRWGEAHGLARDDISYLEWPEIARSLDQTIMDDIDRYYLDIAEKARRKIAEAHTLKLGHILFSARDIYVATLNRSVPNFIGLGRASGHVVQLEANTPTTTNIRNSIVCIENADPGFDWIFTKGLKALVTRFGGANSHMAVRCAEFGLPAAIGCGDQIYRRIAQAQSAELNCTEKILRPLYVN